MILPPFPAGHRHGRLIVLTYERDPHDPKHPYYRCRCDCGRITQVTRANMARTHSCGCIKIELLQAKATHRMSKRREYRIWAGIIARCQRPTCSTFAQYGGRGIRICARWRDSFSAFYADMGPRPSIQHSIDRIDNDGDYAPENCRWATRHEQRMNQRRMHQDQNLMAK